MLRHEEERSCAAKYAGVLVQHRVYLHGGGFNDGVRGIVLSG